MNDFDRLRPRSATRAARPTVPGPTPSADREGKRVLFSVDALPPEPVALGALSVTCSGCGITTQMTPCQALAAALPSVHLPILRRRYPSWMRCPACHRRCWVRIDLRR